MSRYLSLRDLDWPLLLIALLICAVGVVQIYSATRDTGWQDAWWKQIVYILAGLVLMWIIRGGGLPLAAEPCPAACMSPRCWRCWEL